MEELKREILNLREELREVKLLQQLILEKLPSKLPPSTAVEFSIAGVRTRSSSPTLNDVSVLPYEGDQFSITGNVSEAKDKHHSIQRAFLAKESPSMLNMGSSYNLSPIESFIYFEKVISKAMSTWELKEDPKSAFRIKNCMWQECFDLFSQVMTNDVDAVIDLQFRANRGDLSAIAYLMILCGCGIGGVSYNPSQAKEMAIKILPLLNAYDSSLSSVNNFVAMETGITDIVNPADLPHAYFVLAQCYERGWGLPASDDPMELHNRLTQSVKYLRAAARRGHAGAQNHLGYLYELGWFVSSSSKMLVPIGETVISMDETFDNNSDVLVPQVPSEAIRWYTLSADQGYVVAFHNLGNCSETEGNHLQSLRYYQMAAERGYLPSIAQLRK